MPVAKSAKKLDRQRFKVGSLREVAFFFQVSRTTIDNWRSQGMPIESAGGYDLSAIVAWRRQIDLQSRKQPREGASEREALDDGGS